MENWTISCKSIVLLYVIAATQLAATAVTPWYMLAVLLVLCLNLSIYTVKSDSLRPLFMLASAALVAAAASTIDPLFALLLPLTVYELVTVVTKAHRIAWLPMLLPAALLPLPLVVEYSLVALLVFAFHTILDIHTARIRKYKDELDHMRGRVDRLSGKLNENNEYIRQSEYTFKLEERNRLSQEIHDRIGHSMTGALIQMEASKRLLAVDPAKSAELLQNAIHISKEGIESIRLVLKNMKPPTEQLGINRLRLRIDEFSANHPIQTALAHEGNVDIITPIQWKVIEDNTKEALTNAMKYSNATAIAVHIEVLSTLIKVVVSDNGKGSGKIIKGMGIVGMEERTAGLNGTVIVDGSRGFSVTTLLPHANE